MACGGCAHRGSLIGQGLRAVQRGAWQEAAQAASATAQSFRADAARLAAKVAQAAARAVAKGR
jgi:hypothetical protein